VLDSAADATLRAQRVEVPETEITTGEVLLQTTVTSGE